MLLKGWTRIHHLYTHTEGKGKVREGRERKEREIGDARREELPCSQGPRPQN